ncbi:hypothetical protein ACFQ0B_43490 [Nonomuraea thailandensis]
MIGAQRAEVRDERLRLRALQPVQLVDDASLLVSAGPSRTDQSTSPMP